LDDVHRALWDTAGLAAASPPSETFVRHLESCRSRSRADPSFHRFLGEVRDTLQRPQLTDASERRRTLDAVRRVFYRALKEAAYRRAGEYIMAWYPQWLARLGVIRVGGSPGAVDLSRRSVTPRRSARERLLDEQVLERMFMDVPAAYHWTTLEESWIELAKPPLFDVSRLTRRALPRPAQTSEPDRNMVAVALELALADVSPTVPHHASPLLHGKAESAAVDPPWRRARMGSGRPRRRPETRRLGLGRRAGITTP
jgi:hypothetical protein